MNLLFVLFILVVIFILFWDLFNDINWFYDDLLYISLFIIRFLL